MHYDYIYNSRHFISISIYFTVNLLKVYLNQMSIELPAYTHADGVDFVPMNSNKTLIQVLGSRPIFGPMLYGPVAFFDSSACCAVHDYLTGMISIRYGGAHLPALASNF
jgi:carbon starvation protein CstA